MDAIQTIQLTKNYKDLTAVKRLDLEIQKGDLFSLLGVNGAGKTTTIKMLTCLTKPSDGDAIILGNSITKDAAQVKKSSAYRRRKALRRLAETAEYCYGFDW